MLHEFGCTGAAASVPLCYSPDSSDGNLDGGRLGSPEYHPVSSLWAGPPSAQPKKYQKEIVFGPGVQLEGSDKRPDHLLMDISDLVTRMEIDGAGQARPATIA